MISQKMNLSLFIGPFNDGGPFMYFILLSLILALFFIVRAFITKTSNIELSKKMIGLASDASLLALVIGSLGSVIGLIQLFDMVEALGNVRPELFSGGLKVSLLTITFGLFSFVIGRLGILLYNWTLQLKA